jgi:hypothetical protein
MLVKSANKRPHMLVVVLCWLLVVQATAQTPWEAWESKAIRDFSDDGTGSSVALSESVTTPVGRPALRVTPSGDAPETKLAVPFSGEELSAWRTGDLLLELYLPPDTALPPTRVFLGVADVSSAWRWVDGVFAASDLQAGWNAVRFIPSPALRQLSPTGRFMVYLSFFTEGAPLREPFYLGSMLMQDTTDLTHLRHPEYDAEADALLKLDDMALLDAVAQRTFEYFWLEANPENGLVKDRSTPNSASSIAAVGFGLSSIPIAVERGWISREEGYARALTTLQTFATGGVEGHRGFFYHFVDMDTGRRAHLSELSSIDTTLFIAGALTVGRYFADSEVAALAEQLYEAVDWQWMMAGGDTVSMGWLPESGFLAARWAHFDEGLLLYVLGIGSPTHPLPPESWHAVHRPMRDGYIYLPAETLFVYQYPLAWLDLRHLKDAYANYAVNAARACERNRAFAVAQQDAFATYREDVWGLSASDGPFGYRAYGAAPGNHDGTVAPYAPLGCLPFTPEIAVQALRGMLRHYGSLVWRRYGLVSAINEDKQWYSSEHIGIDQGIILLMIENYRSGLIWELFMADERVQRTLEKIGFEASEDQTH